MRTAIDPARGIKGRLTWLTWTNPVLWVAGLTVFAFLLRRFHLGTESLWFDEADIVAMSRQPLGNLIDAFTKAGENGPLYTLMLHFWMLLYDNVPGVARVMHILFGSTFEAPIRGLAMIFGTLGVPAMYLLAHKIGGRALGFTSALLLAINPFDLWYSQDAKMYTLLVLMTLLTTWLYLLALERNTALLWLLYVLATWIMLTAHSLSGLVLLAQIASTPFLLRAARRQQPRDVQNARKPANPHWIWAFTLIIGPVLPIIWLRAAALITGTVESGNWYSATNLLDILLTIFVKFAVNQATPWQINSNFAVSWEGIGALTMGALAVLGAITFLQQNRKAPNKATTYSPQSVIVLSLWLIPVALFWLLTIALPLFHPRYLIMALPAYLILAAAGILTLWRWNSAAVLAPVGLLVITVAAAIFSVNFSNIPQKEDWRAAIQYVQDHIRLRDAIVPFPGYLQTAVKVYYKPGGAAFVPDRPIGTITSLSTEDYGTREMEDELRRISYCNERIWLIVSPVRAEEEDPQNAVLQWFQYNYLTFDTQVFNGVTVYGISFNQVLDCWSPAPDYLEQHTFENGLSFEGYIYELRDQGDKPVQPDASYLPLTLFWKAQTSLPEDYEARIDVISPTGEVVKSDALGPLNGYFPTSQWHPPLSLMDYRDIRLPGGLTPGDYTIKLQVYPEGQPDKPLKLQGEAGDTITFKQPLQIMPWKP